jgi:hypothetical protein
MNKKNKFKVSYRSMSTLAIIVGGVGIILQAIPGWEFFSFFLNVPVLGSLIGGDSGYEEQDRQQLRRSYKTAYEGLLLVIMAAYAFIEFSKWLTPTNGAFNFLNGHWCGLMFAVMCALMGIAGIQGRNSESSPNTGSLDRIQRGYVSALCKVSCYYYFKSRVHGGR